TYEQVLASVVSGDFRIALHVQEIGRFGEDSASFVNVIPEPGSALTMLLGGLLLLRRRRR
ncbi:MAG TPA: MYXO-CTERM sorting domain-containing protein, partial [Luteolibacter sp.]|nr:MYXO-CTERM sorting domain-containing protein [Luteolibacter sp.]